MGVPLVQSRDPQTGQPEGAEHKGRQRRGWQREDFELQEDVIYLLRGGITDLHEWSRCVFIDRGGTATRVILVFGSEGHRRVVVFTSPPEEEVVFGSYGGVSTTPPRNS